MEEGTGIVHIAPGCGAEDFELSRVHDLPVLTPVDEAGRFYDSYGWLHGTSTAEAKDQIIGDLGERGRLLEAGEIVHRYPVCWRCHTPLIFRIVDEWFIACDEIRQPMLDANATVKWTPDFYSKRMDDWLRNMGDWNISRKRYFGLPLPLYPCECGRLNVIGSRAELEERATGGLDQLQELHRPWIDEVPIRCDECGEQVRRIPEVGDAWLDAGIVPFSTLGWENQRVEGEGVRNGLLAGPLGRRPTRPRLLGDVVPRGLGVGDARADSPLVLLAALHVGRARGKGAVQGDSRLREAPRRDRQGDAQVLGERDRGERGHGQDGGGRDAVHVLRPRSAAEPELRLRPSERGQAASPHVLELRLVLRPLREHRGLQADVPRPRGRPRPRGASPARSLAPRADAAARAGGDRRLRALLDAGCHGCMGTLHRRSLQLVHPPLAQALLHARRGGVQDALVRPRPGGARDRAGNAVPRRAHVAESRGVRSPGAGERLSRGLAAAGVRATRTPGCSQRWPTRAGSPS